MHALLLSLLVALAPVDTAREEEIKKELEKLQGVWKFTLMEQDGQPSPVMEKLRGQEERRRVIIVGNEAYFVPRAGTLTLNPSKNPKELDFKATAGPRQGDFLGIYEIDGKTLRIAMRSIQQGERPKSFKGANAIVSIYERDAGATKDSAAAELKKMKEAAVASEKANARPPTTQESLEKILNRLDQIEKRLEAIEKNQKETPTKK